MMHEVQVASGPEPIFPDMMTALQEEGTWQFSLQEEATLVSSGIFTTLVLVNSLKFMKYKPKDRRCCRLVVKPNWTTV